ncbi:MAG: creatininase family protein [Candidatus Poribacteria bacterium]|nr:creatininase family protein [Candidatus Poribacteria bacterium]MDE0502466.1 creatininase family protein [Candidatus Poribacteria bacterium]
MKYGDGCWVDIEQADKNKVVVVPLGSMEQHGHHSPLLTDTYLVTAVAERVENELREETYFLPTLWLGASDHHLDLPGTTSVPNHVYTLVIKNIVRSISKAGFQRIFFLNGHGGNVIPGTQALTELANESDEYNNLWMALASYWSVASPAMAAESHGMRTKQLTHACEYETSMMLALHGEIMRMDRVTASPPLLDSPFFHSERGGRVNVAKRMNTWTPTGAMGGPQHATEEKGESLLNAITDEVVLFLKDFATW